MSSSLRIKANNAKINRCNTLVCVLENPKNKQNLAAVMRNIDSLGIGKLYVVDGYNLLKKDYKKQRDLKLCSASANKWIYVRKFQTNIECLEYLKLKKYISFCTSPHIQNKNNISLYSGNFTHPKLAVWFGNESDGISEEVIKQTSACIQIEMSGIIESLNLACSTGIVLWYIAQKRREFKD